MFLLLFESVVPGPCPGRASQCAVFVDLYVTIFNLPFFDYAPVFAVISIVAGALISMAYQHVATTLKGKYVLLFRTRRP